MMCSSKQEKLGKTKPTRRKFAMSPKVKELIKKRNSLRKNVKNQRTEWLEAEKEVREAKAEAKLDAWSEFIENLEDSDDVCKIWRTIKSLDGAPTSSAPNEALQIWVTDTKTGKKRQKTIVTNVGKADAFVKHYAKVSSLEFSKEEREQNRLAKQKINAPTVDDQSCGSFSLSELTGAIRRMKRKGAPGADDIPPAFIKELGPKALTELLEIFNTSFHLQTSHNCGGMQL